MLFLRGKVYSFFIAASVQEISAVLRKHIQQVNFISVLSIVLRKFLQTS